MSDKYKLTNHGMRFLVGTNDPPLMVTLSNNYDDPVEQEELTLILERQGTGMKVTMQETEALRALLDCHWASLVTDVMEERNADDGKTSPDPSRPATSEAG